MSSKDDKMHFKWLKSVKVWINSVKFKRVIDEIHKMTVEWL